MNIIDLSIPLENDIISDPPGMQPKIRYFNHDQTADQIVQFFPGLQKQDLPDAEGWALEQVELITHNGTHRDAPWHFHSTRNRGEIGATHDSE